MTPLKCPECGNRGVKHRLKAMGEDCWQCRYCRWYAFTVGESDRDTRELKRLQESNPDQRDEIAC
jgi:hypothetical protein